MPWLWWLVVPVSPLAGPRHGPSLSSLPPTSASPGPGWGEDWWLCGGSRLLPGPSIQPAERSSVVAEAESGEWRVESTGGGGHTLHGYKQGRGRAELWNRSLTLSSGRTRPGSYLEMTPMSVWLVVSGNLSGQWKFIWLVGIFLIAGNLSG